MHVWILHNAHNKLLTQNILTKMFLIFITDIVIWYVYSILDLNLSCAMDFWSFMGT